MMFGLVCVVIDVMKMKKMLMIICYLLFFFLIEKSFVSNEKRVRCIIG